MSVRPAGSGCSISATPPTPRSSASFYGGSEVPCTTYICATVSPFSLIGMRGLIILDVGNGVAGGSPTSPVEVGRVQTTGGQTHNAWYWPAGGYVFVGEEDFNAPGFMHVARRE